MSEDVALDDEMGRRTRGFQNLDGVPFRQETELQVRFTYTLKLKKDFNLQRYRGQ